MDETKKRFESERQRFLVTEHCAYLDHASRGPLSPAASEMVVKVTRDLHHVHPDQLLHMNRDFCTARQAMGGLIRAPANSIALIPNTSSGIAMAAGSLPIAAGDNVICAQGEFPANVYPWLNLTHRGVEVRFIEKSPDGITVDQIREAVDERTKVIALSWVGFSNGARIDTTSIGQLCSEKRIYFILDAIQGIGALNIDLEPIHVLVSGSGKWTLSPQGGGFVYLRPSLVEKLYPDRVGWLSMAQNADLNRLNELTDYRFELAQDARRVETGSNSLLTQLPLGASCAYLNNLGIKKVEARIIELCDYLMEGLKKNNIKIVTPIQNGQRSGIVSFSVPDAQTTSQRLIDEGVIVSAREGNIRVGIHFYNNEEDLDRLLNGL